jgi:hypothetical protein
MTRLYSVMTILFLILTSCRQQSAELNIKDYVDHWEISQTYRTYNNSSLEIDTINNVYEIVNGTNQILIATIEKEPIFKKGKVLTDLYSTKSLLIELDTADDFVSVTHPNNSKIYRKLVAFSPQHGIKPLYSYEKITFKRKNNSVWTITSDINDFNFNGEINFLTNQTLINKIIEY